MHCLTYLLFYKHFINGVPFHLKEYAKRLLYGPLKSALKLVHAYTPTSTLLQKQCTSLIKHLNEMRSLINQVPNICSFQGLTITSTPTILRIKRSNTMVHTALFGNSLNILLTNERNVCILKKQRIS